MSISSPEAVLNREVWLLPKGFSVKAYLRIFENQDVWLSFYNTIWYTTVGTMINVSMTLIGAYVLSRKEFFLRNFLTIFMMITMFFSGGLIPLFLLIKNLHLYNTRWALVIPGAVSFFNVVIARTYIQTSIPEELLDAARIDGANDIRILFTIVVPLSKPIIAVLSIFSAVGHWNSYFPALLYLQDQRLHPLQLYLRKILILNDPSLVQAIGDVVERTMYALQLKYAIIIVATLPILFIYPFFQKYFVKGILIGSLKG
jgi:putative aldouronate transport system permease protein